MPSFIRYFFTILCILLCTAARAQFSVTGDDPASVRWHKTETADFKLIHPASMDSLARVYGAELEKARLEVSWSSGLTIGQCYRSKMPSVLHPFYSLANASVTWAPKRMDIFTVPDPYSPTPVPWPEHLAIHEGRHAAQMQFGASGVFRPFHYLVGEMFAGALAGIYPGPVLLEGDAVVAETALSKSGRGRQSSFLNYMMPAFDCGDWRDYWKWVYGSQKLYAPDYYRTGYLLVAGTRVFFDDPLFTKEYFDRTTKSGGFSNLQATVKDASGMNFKDSFKFIEKGFYGIWFAEALKRGPFMPSRQVTSVPSRHTDYAGAVSDGKSVFALKKSLTSSRSLVKLNPDGSEERMESFAYSTSRLFYDANKDRLYWTETVPHWRWTLKSDSRIRYIEASTPGKVHDLVKGGKYFNSRPSPDGSLVSAVEYPVTGGSRLCLVRADDGSAVKAFISPDSLQFTESVWIGSDKDAGGPSSGPGSGLKDCRLFVSGLSGNGMGIYEILGQASDGKAVLRKVLGPQPVELDNLGVWPDDGRISFTCDRTGIKELYILNVDSGILLQSTSTRYGIGDPFLNDAADTLFYSSVASSDDPSTYKQGRMLYATSVADLPMKAASFEDIHHWFVADALTEQEKSLADKAEMTSEDHSEIGFSVPKRYSKIRFPHIHSWAPVYFNYDNIEDISSDDYYKASSLGATALFQNLFGNGYGFVGYSYHEDPLSKGSWRHTGHFKYYYSGLMPVFEVTADFNDRERYELQRVHLTYPDKQALYTRGRIGGTPYLNLGIKAYLPINLGSGGLSRGIIPQVKYSFTNDIYNDAISIEKQVVDQDGTKKIVKTGTKGEDSASYLRTLNMSLRGYVLRQTASSQIYPSLGIGAEIGYHSRPGHSNAFKSAAYIYSYGYLPGFIPQQGFRLSATLETNVGDKSKFNFPEGAVTTMPRGFTGSNLQTVLNLCSSIKFKASVDYAIPVFPVDWSFLGPLAYIRNFELIPFCDFAWQKYGSNAELTINPNNVAEESLFSLGADFNVHLGNLLWLPYDTRIGIRYSRNFWQHLDALSVTGLNHNYVGWTFTIDM